ncbi:zinc finger CCCH domain-containing protein 34-like isoform X2 [Rosa rugosa]|uniref:zinc finger CCCH domain-containing protein 34-like isoform X2 n=1 Tax=Rosa rugosa TaxID=74645 RepID=UPI002B406796|nr:zinc finger CCCH domain-containing protein 34-like isoform X2 [Rosa rugosa]XP_062012959.1 zinc finger CCCH domain-containing protein 34-like isoform X2 [Rosa rugosa]
MRTTKKTRKTLKEAMTTATAREMTTTVRARMSRIYVSQVTGALRAGAVEYPERLGQPVCQYYMRTGMSKFGATCKYHHPKQGGGSAAPVSLNYYGYSLRPGERECSYYVKTGQIIGPDLKV